LMFWMLILLMLLMLRMFLFPFYECKMNETQLLLKMYKQEKNKIDAMSKKEFY
jgi:hypothetical protein